MTAPTTRETADHAELAVAWRVKDFADGWIVCGSEQTAIDLAVAMSGATIQPLFGPALLSEIAALRGERDGLRSALDVCNTARLHWENTVVPSLADRATQAERQRDELRKAVKNIGDAEFIWEAREAARQVLASQGAE